VRRILAAGCGALTLASGVAARAFLTGALAKILGVALWAALVYFIVAFFAPSWRPRRVATLTIAISWAVELAQLTPGPAWLSSKHVLLRMIFGTTFSAWDLPMYVGGAILGAAVHRLWRGP
jgi:hypothetical protein